jgi:Flp pilus assembly protein TadG
VLVTGRRTGRRPARREETGAVAIIVSIVLTLVLIPVAALAVDLGSVYTRTASLQRIADEAARAGAVELAQLQRDPAASQIADRVRELAVRVLCATSTQADPWQDLCSGSHAWASDGDPANGEVTVSEGTAPQGLLSRVRVLTPPSRVEYGLAGAFTDTGHADPQRAATAQLRSALPVGGVLPIFATAGPTGTGEVGAFCARSAPRSIWQNTHPGGAACDPAQNGSIARGYLDVRRTDSGQDGHRAVWNAAVGIDAAHLPVVGSTVRLQPQSGGSSALLRDLAPGLFGGDGSYGAPARLTRSGCAPPGGGASTVTSGPFSGLQGAYLADFADQRGWLQPGVLRCGRLAVLPQIAVTPPLPYYGLTGSSYQVTRWRVVWLDDRVSSTDQAPVGTGTCLQRGFYWADPDSYTSPCQTALRAITGYFVDPRLLPVTVSDADAPPASQISYLGSGLPAVVHLIRDVGDPPPG